LKPVRQYIDRKIPAAKSDRIGIGHQVVSLEESGQMMTGIGDWCDPGMCSQIVCKEEEKGKSEGLVERQLREHNGGDIVSP
jgi:hypothetical protein